VIMMDEWVSIIGNLGFPIAVAGYLLVRVEAKLDGLTSAITALKETIGVKA
jgi:hypothetical protein